MHPRFRMKSCCWMGRLWAVVLVLLLLVGCKARGAERNEVLEVFAASSLREVFEDLEKRYERVHPGTDLRLNFNGSQILRLQIEGGAHAQVFASADPAHLNHLLASGLADEPFLLAGGELALITPLSNPAEIHRFSDLARAKTLVLAASAVPLGAYTEELLKKASQDYGEAFIEGVWKAVASRELNARLVRAKVELGEADAAIVYRSDALASERVSIIELPRSLRVETQLSIAAVGSGRASELAGDWLAFLKSSEARESLRRHGFAVKE